MNKHAHGDVVRRREEIRTIIAEQTIHSQEELERALARRGFKVAQPTLSRDLRELGVVKTPSGYALPGLATVTPITAFQDRFEASVREYALSAAAGVNLVVLKTAVAAAQPLASAIDAARLDDVLGTVAGDDTIFIAMTTPGAAAALVRRVESLLGHPPVRRAAH